jgi:hypothetical protein
MSLAAKVKPVPHLDIATLYGPMSVLGPINPAETLDREALAKVVDGFERTTQAALLLGLDHPLLETTADEVKLEGDREEWQATLETCRQTSELLNGTKARVFRRWVAIGLPERAAAFIQLQDRAIAHYRQMIAWLAFMLGEDDEIDLQRSLVPTDEAGRAPAPSVPLDLD